MEKSTLAYEFKTPVFNPKKEINLVKKIVEHMRTKKNGDKNYQIPTDPSQDKYGNCPEDERYRLVYMNPRELHFFEDSQRSRDSVLEDAVLKKMEKEFDWNKCTPLQAIIYHDDIKNKDIYVCYDGQGRTMFFLTHPNITEVPVLVRKANDYERAAINFELLHDNRSITKILIADDMKIHYEQGQEYMKKLVEYVQDAGFKYTFKRAKGANSVMVFDQSDWGRTGFWLKEGIKNHRVSKNSLDSMKQKIFAYAKIRRSMNGGYSINYWSELIGNIDSSINALKNTRTDFPDELSLDNLIKQTERSYNLTEKQKIGMFGTRNSKEHVKYRATRLLRWLEKKNLIGLQWMKKHGNSNYLNMLIDKIHEI